MIIHLLVSIVSFIGIWIGSGLAVKSVERLSHRLKASAFVISFLVLGFFTSVSEFSVGVNSLIQNDPEIYVGNLIGASIVLVLLVVPLLAIVSSSINVRPEFQGVNLPLTLVVIAMPAILALDGIVSKIDSYVSLILFGLLVVGIQTKKGFIEKLTSISLQSKVAMGRELLRIVVGIFLIFVASRFIVEQTEYFADILKVSPFFISLLVIALGTNIPELSLIVRSVFMKNQQVAFGDYLGSASVNTFLFGILTLFYGQPVILNNNYLASILFLIVGLVFFYLFARTKHTISRLEGLVLFFIYTCFLLTEISVH